MADDVYDSWILDAFGISVADAGDEEDGSGVIRSTGLGSKIAAPFKAVAKKVNDKLISAASGPYDELMKNLDEQIKAVKDAGLDATPYEAQAKGIRDAYAEALDLPDLTKRMSASADLGQKAQAAADQAKADVAKLKKSAVEGVTGAITGMRDGAKALIDKLPKDGTDTADLVKRLADLDKSIKEAGDLTDRAERAKQLKVLNQTAQTLFDDAAKASTDKTTVQAVYKKALMDRYGIDIQVPPGMENTHLDQVYKMFDKVPEADVVQNKMKTLAYQPLNDDGTKNDGAAFGGATIFMGDYGAEDWPYQDPATGAAVPANGFSISTLHELGHSVDDRFKVMQMNQGKSGGGGWKLEKLGAVADAFIGEFNGGAGKDLKLAAKVLKVAAETALSTGTTDRPAKVTDPDWVVLEPFLETCANLRSDKWPWDNPHDIGGRAFHEAYPGEWWSYDTAVRAKKLTVRGYQWRSPAEWFAELYAYSFYKSEPPPGGVDPAIAAYMYGGASAGTTPPTS